MSSTAPAEIAVSPTPDGEASGPLAEALAGEEAAIWAYGLIGGLLADTDGQARALLAMDTHRAARTWLRDRILAGGKSPAIPPTGYQPTEPVIDDASARRLAAQVEAGLVPLWVDVAGAVQGADRKTAAQYGAGCSGRSVSWGGPTRAFPASAPVETTTE